MLTEVSALIPPVVGGAVQHHQIRCRRVVEELGEMVEGEGIRIGTTVRMGDGTLFLEPTERRWVLTRHRVLAAEHPLRVVEGGSPICIRMGRDSGEPQVPVCGGDLVDVRLRRPCGKVDDRLERGGEEHLEDLVPLPQISLWQRHLHARSLRVGQNRALPIGSVPRTPGGQAKTALPVGRRKSLSASLDARRCWIGMNCLPGSD